MAPSRPSDSLTVWTREAGSETNDRGERRVGGQIFILEFG